MRAGALWVLAPPSLGAKSEGGSLMMGFICRVFRGKKKGAQSLGTTGARDKWTNATQRERAGKQSHALDEGTHKTEGQKH